MPRLINAAQLEKLRLDQKNVVILDATWGLQNDLGEAKDPKQAFKEQRIIGARFFDLAAFYDASSAAHLLIRDEQAIAEKLGALGLTNELKIILYDNSNLRTSCRAFWMLKVFGHPPQHLYILDGGFNAWKKFGGKIESGEPRSVVTRAYAVNYQAQYIRTLMQMKSNMHHPMEQVVDVRHPVRYAGGPESRPGLRSGHIPGSFSFYYMTMFDKEGYLKPLEKIRKQLTGIGVELDAPIVTNCGSGTTAATLNFVLDLLDHTQHALYDGSWSEWGTEALYHGEESLAERPVLRSVDV